MSRRVAVLIAGSPTPAFYSQVAAISVALDRLEWSRWEPSVHLYLGGEFEPDSYAAWLPHLHNVEISWVSQARYDAKGWWEQSDDVFRMAPRDADVFLALDADVLPFASFEGLLDRVVETGSVAGVMAHTPFPGPRTELRQRWLRLAEGLIDEPLDFSFEHTFDESREWGPVPFYPNMGAVFFDRGAFDVVAPRYLALRAELESRMEDPDFSGQVALTLALTAERVPLWALPMRYNFPNDPRAEQFFPAELEAVVLMHYLRTKYYDRHDIFADRDAYARLLELPLEGVDLIFQQRVRSIFGSTYPFA